MTVGFSSILGGVDQVVEEADPVAQRYGHEFDVHLVDQPCVEALLDDTGAGQVDRLVAGGRLRLSTARSTPSVTTVSGASSRGQPSGGLWVTTKTATPSG